MILFPPAKINLGLNILGKRDDGFHEIDTCLVSVPIYDVLEIVNSTEFEFKQTGLPILGNLDTNLVVKACKLVQSKFEIPPVYIHLQKNIPMGAGLGGGSADATYTIRGLNSLFNLGLSKDEVQDIAAQLGSDCPFFAKEGPQNATGRGEKLKDFSLDLSNHYLKVVYPNVHISTENAFSKVSYSADGESIEKILSKPMEYWRFELKNDFESAIFEAHPTLEAIKHKLYNEGAVYASMTGSGSSFFGIFEKKPKLTFSLYFERIMKL